MSAASGSSRTTTSSSSDQPRCQVRRGAAALGLTHFSRRARRDDPAAVVAGAGSEVDHPVRPRDHAHVVFGDDDGVARVDKAVQLRIEQLHIGRMQPGGGLVEHVERVPAAGPLQFGGELDALRLAAGQLGRGLPETQIAQPDVAQRRQAPRRGRNIGEKLRRPRRRSWPGRRRWCGRDSAPQCLLVVARAVAGRAGGVSPGRNNNSTDDEALALAGRAAAFGDVEREPAGRPAAAPRRRRRGEPVERRRTCPCRWPASSAACARSGFWSTATSRSIASAPTAVTPTLAS